MHSKHREKFRRTTSERLANLEYLRRVGTIPREQLRVLPGPDGTGMLDAGRENATAAYMAALQATGDTAEIMLERARKALAQARGVVGKPREKLIAALVDNLSGLDQLVAQLAGVSLDLRELLTAEDVDVTYEVDGASWRGERDPDAAPPEEPVVEDTPAEIDDPNATAPTAA